MNLLDSLKQHIASALTADTKAPQYPAAWPNGRSLPVVLQSDPQGRFPKNGRCITEGRSRGDCSYLSELQSPNDPGRPSRNTETTERKSDLHYNDRSGALARQ